MGKWVLIIGCVVVIIGGVGLYYYLAPKVVTTPVSQSVTREQPTIGDQRTITKDGQRYLLTGKVIGFEKEFKKLTVSRDVRDNIVTQMLCESGFVEQNVKTGVKRNISYQEAFNKVAPGMQVFGVCDDSVCTRLVDQCTLIF